MAGHLFTTGRTVDSTNRTINNRRNSFSWTDDTVISRRPDPFANFALPNWLFEDSISWNAAGRNSVSTRGTSRWLPASGGSSGKPAAAKGDSLVVEGIDLKIESNGEAHHTADYEISAPDYDVRKLVLRRGQLFNMDVQLNRSYDPAKDDLRLIFLLGDKPVESKGTHVECVLSDKDVQNEWGAKILENKGQVLTVTVFTPPNLFVGKWTVNVDVLDKGDGSTLGTYEHGVPIYIIFNPWCKEDTVFLDDEKKRQEYVLNETGRIFTGSSRNISSRPWNFGQFEDHVLDVAFYLMDKGDLKWMARGNPVLVARKLTALVNSNDDQGVLVGNWSGKYTGGTPPTKWTGSPAILEEYWKTKQSVRFGQCWVFSGLNTTLMRALGIPVRSVTNFGSAHDTDGSVSIDYHYGYNGEPDKEMDSDSVWNFHVWNEVWMARPDLSAGYGGWQVVDATPQESSYGVMVCGPAPVTAVKNGDLNLPHDIPFVFAEVNADQVYWMRNMLGKYEVVYKDTRSIGKFISTKACLSNEREDITHCYKFPEGSPEERTAVRRANLTGSTREDIYTDSASDVSFEVEQDSPNTWVGRDFVVSLRIKNTSSETRTVQGRAVVSTMYYTGVLSDKILSEVFSEVPLVILAGKEVTHRVTVKPDQYLDFLRDCAMLDVTFWASVVETKQSYLSKNNFQLKKPELTIKAPTDAKRGEEFKVEISFVNPLDRQLTGCALDIDGLAKTISFPQMDVGAKGKFSVTVPVTATKKGQKELIVVFSSAQLEDISGSHPVFVKAG